MSPIEALVTLSLGWVDCDPKQTPAECAEHRESIATDVLAVSSTDPLPWPKLNAEQRTHKTAVLLMAVASLESRYDDAAVSRTGDHCVLQVHPLGDEDVSTRRGCVEAGLSRVHWSWITCHASPSWLSPYTTGKCYTEQKHAKARQGRGESGWVKFKLLTRPHVNP